MSVTLLEGEIFGARYRVVRKIALGGMGAVYEVMHLETERRLALKVMLPHIVQSDEMRDRFRREARVAAQVQSEHIVDVLDAGVDDASGMPFMVMELLRGEEVSKALRRVGRFEAVEVVTLLHQASLALDKTHRGGIIHRDLKPENLFLTEREDGQPRVKVLDFGIAKLLAEGATQDPGTRSLGTPLYMAPEQFRSGMPISAATDIYALGMIAFTMLVGKSYWAEEAKDASNVFMFAGAVMAGTKEPASVRARKLGVPLPPAFDAWFARATALMPQDRWPSAGMAVAGLADALGVAHPGFSTTGGGLRITATGTRVAAAPAPAAPAEGDEAATMIYAGSQPGSSGPHSTGPQLGSSAPHATGPQSMGAPMSTGNAYGLATGAAAAPAPSGKGNIVAAVGVGFAIGAIGLAALFLAGGRSGAVAAAPTAIVGAPTIVATATAAATTAPVVSAGVSASATASAEPAASATATASAQAATPPPAAPKGAAPPARKASAPSAPPEKKSIYVRD
jgi:serine/threonine-protein kinase